MNFDTGLELTEKLDSWHHQTTAEAAHICVPELMKPHSSSSTLLSKTLEEKKKTTSLAKKQKVTTIIPNLKHVQSIQHDKT